MKKSTINAILISVITLMSVSICFLIFCIATRPRYVIVNEPDTAMITEASNLYDETLQPENPSANTTTDAAPSVEAPAVSTMHGKTSTRVNIRNAASEDAKVLITVDEGTTFDILEILDNGWTRILYEGSEAYISSSYVIITNG